MENLYFYNPPEKVMSLFGFNLNDFHSRFATFKELKLFMEMARRYNENYEIPKKKDIKVYYETENNNIVLTDNIHQTVIVKMLPRENFLKSLSNIWHPCINDLAPDDLLRLFREQLNFQPCFLPAKRLIGLISSFYCFKVNYDVLERWTTWMSPNGDILIESKVGISIIS